MNDQKREINRRNFLRTAGTGLGVAGLAAVSGISKSSAAEEKPVGKKPLIAKNDVVLFMGASVTDAGRNREKGSTPNIQEAMGTGYAWMAAMELLVDRPDDGLKFYNRGVSGNKVFMLAERWDRDCLALKPNVLSILIGVNDYWHTIDPKINYKGTLEIYERDYRALVERTLKALPDVKLIIFEQCVVRCGVVNDSWFPEFDRYRAAAKRVAESYNALFIPLHPVLEEAIKYAPPEHWAKDGVHPTAEGASLMAYHWLKAVQG